jgi:hydroxymethylpyrimidine pyrophosphatase-like HAD family hydrolase
MLIWCSNELYCNELNDRTNHYQKICGVEPTKIKKIDELHYHKITKVLWYADENTIQNMLVLLQSNYFNSSISVFKSQPCFLEIVNRDVSIRKSAKYFGKSTWYTTL